MREPYLRVTYRRGSAQVAYLYLPRRPGEKSFDCERVEPGMILDFNRQGKLIGIELTAPSKVTLGAINEILKRHGLVPLKKADLAPLRAA